MRLKISTENKNDYTPLIMSVIIYFVYNINYIKVFILQLNLHWLKYQLIFINTIFHV